MVKTPGKPTLSVVDPDSSFPQPPRPLGQHGLRLWNSVMADYAIDDIGGIELLTLICQATDRAESCRETIDKDGERVKTRTGMRSHPLLRDELQNRAFIARTLDRLGITAEAVKSMGRPSEPVGWRPR